MGNLVLAYLGFILKMFVEMAVLTAIWKAVAKIKLRFGHLLAVGAVAAVILVVTEEVNYHSTGHYSREHPESMIGFVSMALYLTGWTLWTKNTKKKSPDGSAPRDSDNQQKSDDGISDPTTESNTTSG